MKASIFSQCSGGRGSSGPAARAFASCFRPLCWSTALAAALLVWPSPGRAELSVESLTGTAVSGGPHVVDIQDAIKKFLSRDIEGARKKLEEAKAKTKRLAPPEVMMAQMFFSVGQLNLGRIELERATRQVPKEPEA